VAGTVVVELDAVPVRIVEGDRDAVAVVRRVIDLITEACDRPSGRSRAL
jgi:hypothetical protein